MNTQQKLLPIILILFCLLPGILHAQVGINATGADPDASAILDVSSTDKGMLIPRMSTAQRTAIASPATSLLVFDTDTGSFWFYNGSAWTELGAEIPSSLSDDDGDTKIELEASPDEDIIRLKAGNVDAMEIVGPDGSLQIASGVFYSSSGLPWDPISAWQSFTAPENADIVSIQIYYNQNANVPVKNFKLYLGEGTGGTELTAWGPDTLSHGWNTIPLSVPVSMTSGQKYTIWFSNRFGVGLDPTNPCPDGRSSISPGDDYSIHVAFTSSGSVHIHTPLEVNGPVTATAFNLTGTATVNAVAFPDGTVQTTAPKTYSIGDFAQGGVVFWVDETGQHGLVCAKSDQSTGVRWDAGTNGRTQALGTGVYAGKMNTLLIIAGHVAIGDDNNPYAARICAELEITEGGVAYGDWYLPSIKELSLMYDNKSTINATATANGGSSFTTDQYWSSEEDVHVSRFGGGLQYMARNFYFDNYGGDGSIIKSGNNRVRAVRAF